MRKLDQMLEKLAALHGEIHQNDGVPKNEQEAQAEIVLNGVQKIILNLLYQQECNLRTIELSLFYFWHHLFVRNVDLEPVADELPFEQTMPEVIRLIQEIVASIKDDGADPQMETLGQIVSELKEAVTQMGEITKSQQQIKADVEKTNTSIAEFINGVISHGAHPILVQNILFYYWLRSSTITANVEESLFQKIERNWIEVIDVFNPAYLNFIKTCV